MKGKNESPRHFLVSVIRPTLLKLDKCSHALEQLLLGTAIQESHLCMRKQIHGPALGLFQMEPATHDDIWENYLQFRPKLSELVLSLVSDRSQKKLSELQFNDAYAVAMARIRYMRVSQPLPALNDIPRMAAYWKRHYNTPLGKGKESEFIANWNRLTAGEKLF